MDATAQLWGRCQETWCNSLLGFLALGRSFTSSEPQFPLPLQKHKNWVSWEHSSFQGSVAVPEGRTSQQGCRGTDPVKPAEPAVASPPPHPQGQLPVALPLFPVLYRCQCFLCIMTRNRLGSPDFRMLSGWGPALQSGSTNGGFVHIF